MQTRAEFLKTGLEPTETVPESDDCAVCTDAYTDSVKIQACGHRFCRQCICQWLSLKSKNTCPTCRRVLFALDDSDRGPIARTREQVVAMNEALLNSRLLTGEFHTFNAGIRWSVSDMQRATAAANFWLGEQHHTNAAGPAIITSRRLGHHIITMGNLLLGHAQALQRPYNRDELRDWCRVLRALYDVLDTRDGMRMDALVMVHHLRSEIQVSLAHQGLDVPPLFRDELQHEALRGDLDLLLQYVCQKAVEDFGRHEQRKMAAPKNTSLMGKFAKWAQQYWTGR
ncbi:hypothetical protein AC578_8178 [Pseudocercospora eumusae]|uniref:RING-type domain-containing protein n=1 Tax=Pseudocercospora eumusae TaxID=321146 RepID=A0A139HET9_9PEZI|nr:hypothetical protein AC578_8178 [Pseudocercospora eumusae]